MSTEIEAPGMGELSLQKLVAQTPLKMNGNGSLWASPCRYRWFQLFFFHPENWGRFPIWPGYFIFFKWVETT